MSIGSPGKSVQAYYFDHIAKPLGIIKDVLHHQTPIDKVTRVLVHPCGVSGGGIGIVHRSHEPKRLNIFAHHDSLGEGQITESCGWESTDGGKSSWNGSGASPLAGRQDDVMVERHRGTPAIRILDNGSVFEKDRGISESICIVGVLGIEVLLGGKPVDKTERNR